MKFFFGCIRKYRLITAISIILLFAEAVCCLYVPFILGNIIGTGLQCKGFSDDFPFVVSKNAFALFCEVLPEKNTQELLSLYALQKKAPSETEEKYRSDKTCYYFINEADREKAAQFFRNAAFSAVLLARNSPQLDNFNADELLDSVSLDSIYILAKKYELSEEEKEEYFRIAENTDTALKIQVTDMLLPYIYEDAGIDCDSIQKEFIKSNSILCIAVLLLQFLCAAASSYLIAKLSVKFEKEMRLSVIKKSFSFTKEERAKLPADSALRYYESEAASTGIAVNLGFRLIFNSLFIGIIGSIVTFMKSAVFGAFILGSALLIVISLTLIFILTYKRFYRMQDNYRVYSNMLKTILDRIFTVRMMKAEKTEKRRISEVSSDIKKDESYVLRSLFSALGVIGLAVNLLTVLIVITGGNSMLQADISLGNIITYLQYSLITVSSFMMLGAAVLFLPASIKALKGLDKFLAIPVKEEISDFEKVSIDHIDKLRFEKVKLFENSKELSFEIKKGQAVAIVGSTGSGKTLLTDALMREFTPASGEIYINSHNIKDINNSFPSGYIARAFSKPVIYSSTVRINMYLAGAVKSDKVLLSALQKAGCDFITEKENCLDTFLENAGANYSGGQRSRLSLAGVLAKKADVYIFDDCLTSVDRNTKNKILENIYKLKKDALVIIISTDPEDIKDADIKIDLDSV